MEDQNAFFRRLHLEHVPSTNGIPDFYLSTVRMFRTSFQGGLSIGTRDYDAVCAFLDDEGYGFRQIGQILDFSFDLGYVNVLNALGHIANDELRRSEIERVERLLSPHGLSEWRLEDEHGRGPQTN